MPVITTNVVGGAGEKLTALRLEKDGYFKVYLKIARGFSREERKL